MSESSVKRWCDQGYLELVRTPGGHRRISVDSVIRFAREGAAVEAEPRSPVEARRALVQALVHDSEEDVVALVEEQWRAGVSLAVVADSIVAPALADIGDRWARGRLQIWQERRACELVLRAIRHLGSLLPARAPGAPTAIGGTLSGDPFTVSTALVEIVLRGAGFDARSLGTWLPGETIANAIHERRPRLVWLAFGIVDQPKRLLEQAHAVARAANDVGAAFVVGGQGLAPTLRRQLRYTAFCDGMIQLGAFASALG